MRGSVESGSGEPHPAPTPTPHAPPGALREHAGSIKLTLTSLLIAFALTLVFRGFILEAFIIPTGSMAPTLLGRHWRISSPASGLSWGVNSRTPPIELENGERLIESSDPISRAALESRVTEPAPGDRILVLKWPFALRDPDRWDVVVFKNPEAPRENYIKRLVGLPGEDVWLVDGDVFVREHASGGAGEWTIARKPERVQRELWQTVWSSEHAWREGILHGEVGTNEPSAYDALPPSRTALDPTSEDGAVEGETEETDAPRSDRAQSSSPWTGDGWVWINNGRSLMSTSGAGALVWDSANWPITDWTPYNEPRAPTARDARRFYPVNDVRVRFVVEPLRSPLTMTIRVRSGGWEIVASASADPDLGMKGYGAGVTVAGGERDWIRAGGVGIPPLPFFRPGARSTIDLAAFDQSAELRLDGWLVNRVYGAMTPHERLLRATGKTEAEVDSLLSAADDPSARGNPLADPTLFTPPEISIEFSGPVTLHRLGVDRDIYYRPGVMETDPRIPARATHPGNIATLSGERGARGEFFVLGDNSGASRDGRLWDTVNPWVASEIDANDGVVPRALMLGEAFFVYFPSPHVVRIAGRDRRLLPDFGRMRWIK